MADAAAAPPSSHKVSEKSERSSAPHPRVPSTTIVTRSRKASSPSRESKQEKDGGERPPTPESPPFRLTRKRTASLIDKAEDQPTEPAEAPETPATATASSGITIDTVVAPHVCLCQPDPKIPRPRNAFILYRQHHQAAVVGRHPGLANPEISKIIGEQWRAESDSVRSEWKTLAEEEKLRHQQQYPEYRYQPKRGGRRGSFSDKASSTEKYTCTKCGGRSISTPNSAFGSSSSFASTNMLPPPTPSLSTPGYLPPRMNNLSLQSPLLRRGGRMGGPQSATIQVVGRRSADDIDMMSPLSPDAKRRRFNQSVNVPNHLRGSGPGTPYPYPTAERRSSSVSHQQLPRPEQLLRGPPRFSQSHIESPHSSGLTLPPLQNAIESNDQSRSVEAMVMSMHYWGKIRILGRIALPLKPPGPASPAYAIRGAIIAVEGDDVAATQKMAHWLENLFNKGDEYSARVADGPRLPPPTNPTPRSPNSTSSRNDAASAKSDLTLADYHQVIQGWHMKSREMIEYITTPVPVPSSPSNNPTTTPDQQPPPTQFKTPILILPGYQLRASDAWASRVPIGDAYSPSDHWQWMATLWRGVVGPDVTVFIKDVGGDGDAGAGGPGAPPGTAAESTRCVVVKRKAGCVDDSSLRRLGFEVSEWVRAVGGEKKE
ncbi:hypothetical protein K490DRAFT_35466 [Saccharata proteae CBS 121410]|uniref:HMG box domain-containing protein n=1 Tax=Saccharata proteae CBS 121410 TaxID=1314787 RepID=A0A9P4HXR8_9PEZI|nr:hypothetical protein K490DRAFT_35466 [Saccharata proteae CBS 121410]